MENNKKKLPLEQDVDIEFEYKVYMLYDFLKKNKKFVIGGTLLIIALIGTFFYYKQQKNNMLNNSSLISYQIQEAFNKKDFKKVKQLISKMKKEYPDSPFMKVALAYNILLKKETNKATPNDINKLQVRINSHQLNAGLNEFKGYLYYKANEYSKTLNILKSIDQKYYNYVSALTLKGFTFKRLNQDDKALSIFNQVLELSKYEYFKLVAKENL